MKTEMEVIDGSVLVIETLEKDLKVVIDIPTGEVLHFEFAEVHIPKFERFVKAAKNRYNRFMGSKAAESFLE
jgi:hypothetical protein